MRIHNDTVTECLDDADGFLLEGKTAEAAVMVQMAQVRAYEDRTKVLRAITGEDKDGSYDQYVQKICDSIEAGFNQLSMSVDDSALNAIAQAIESHE